MFLLHCQVQTDFFWHEGKHALFLEASKQVLTSAGFLDGLHLFDWLLALVLLQCKVLSEGPLNQFNWWATFKWIQDLVYQGKGLWL